MIHWSGFRSRREQSTSLGTVHIDMRSDQPSHLSSVDKLVLALIWVEVLATVGVAIGETWLSMALCNERTCVQHL
jgi:hypothetical protein